MSHEITATDNMFSVREMPWMGLLDGQVKVLSDVPTRAEAQAIAHPWEPISEPIYRQVPVIAEDGTLSTEFEVIPEAVEFRRSDNGDHLAVNSATYTAVTNGEMYDIAEALEGNAGEVLYETGGSLAGGKRVWLMMRLAEPLVIKGDPHGLTVPYYLLQNAHDRSSAFRGQATQIRVVCANTSRMADLDASQRGSEFAFSHTPGVTERIEEAREALAGWRESIEAYKLLGEHMVGLKVSREAEREFVERFIPAPLATMTSDRVKDNIELARMGWWDCYRSVTGEGIEGTAWGLLQASSEWSEHIRRANSQESRFKRAMLDSNTVMTAAKVLAFEAATV